MKKRKPRPKPLKKSPLRAVKVDRVPVDGFDDILRSLRHDGQAEDDTGENNDGGWALPLSGVEDGEGLLLILPRWVDVPSTRALIEKVLKLKLEDYDIIFISDDR